MLRKILVAAGLIAALTGGTAFAVGMTAGEHVACATAFATAPGYTNADHVIADNGTGVYTIPGSSSLGTSDTQTACVTATDQTVPGPTTTVTGPTTTVTTTVTTTTTAPPPPSKKHFKGPILFRYGSSYGARQTTAGAGYDRYGVVVVGYGDDSNAVALPTAKALTYKTMAEVYACTSSDACLTGVSQSDALASDVLLKNASGALLTGTYAGGTYWLGDIGSTTYQNLWVQKVASRLTSQGLDGVFIDNLFCDPINELATNGPAAKYPTLASERTAALSFATNVGAQLQAQGFYVLANTFCWGDGTASSNDGWWTQVAPNVNGLITETFEQNPSGANYYDLRFNGPTISWMGDWVARHNVLTIAQDAGSDAFELTSAIDPATTAGKVVEKYGCATFLLKWNGLNGGCGSNTGGIDPYDAAGWNYPIGVPTGPITASGKAFYRTFTGGKVIVNPDQTQSQTVLGVAVAAKTAYVGP